MIIREAGFQQRVGRHIVAHHHRNIEFHYIVGGLGYCFCEKSRYNLRCGDFFCVRPGHRHYLRPHAYPAMLSQYIVFMELDELEPGFLDQVCACLAIPALLNIGTRNRHFFEGLLGRQRNENRFIKRAAEHQWLAFLYELLGGQKAGGATVLDRHVEEALRIMQNSVRQKLTLADLCVRLHLERSYFVRLFKKHIGQPPLHYFMNLKINLAAELLCQTDMAIYEIAQDLQFADEFHFSRTFKKVKGVAPREYRK